MGAVTAAIDGHEIHSRVGLLNLLPESIGNKTVLQSPDQEDGLS